MRYLSLPELLVLHDHIIADTGGSFGVRDLPALEMEVFLVLNHHEIEAGTDEQEHIILSIASGQLNRPDFEQWLRQHTKMVRQF